VPPIQIRAQAEAHLTWSAIARYRIGRDAGERDGAARRGDGAGSADLRHLARAHSV